MEQPVPEERLQALLLDDQQDPYALEALLATLPEDAHGQVLGQVLQRWQRPLTFTLRDLKEEHAFGVLLGRPLRAFPGGRYEMYGYNSEPLDEDPLLFRIDEHEQVRPGRAALGEEDFGGGFDAVNTDGTLFGALHQVLEWVRLEMSRAGVRGDSGPAGDLAAIRDPFLRAEVRWMRDGNPRLERSLAQCAYVGPLFALRPEAEFVVAWESMAPLADIAQVIVRLPG